MLRRILPILVLLLFWQTANAMPVDLAPTVGYRVANADLIVRGIVTSIEKVASPDSKLPSAEPWWKITIEVHETLRGPASKAVITFSHQDNDWAHCFTEQLFFLSSAKRSIDHMHPEMDALYNSFDWTCESFPEATIDLDALPTDIDHRLITDDLRLLSTKEEVLREIRHVASLNPTSVCEIMLPTEIQKRLGLRESDGVLAFIALNDETYADARTWITSLDPQLQWCGAEVLVQKYSPENANALRQFAWIAPVMPYYGQGPRAKLLAKLWQWGVRDAPTLVQPSAPFFNVKSSAAWFSLLGPLLAPILYLGWKRWSGRGISVIAMLWLISLGVIAVLAIRSQIPRDAVTKGNYDVAIEHGVVYVMPNGRAMGSLPSPLVFCEPMDLLQVRSAGYWACTGSPLNDYGAMDATDLFSNKSIAKDYELDKNKGLCLYPPTSWIGRQKYAPPWAIPIWSILAVMLAPGVFIYAWRSIRWLRTRRRRGFPVQLSTPNP